MSKLRVNEIDTITGGTPIDVERLAADRQNYLSNYDSFSDAISSASILGKSLIIDQPVDLGRASVDCLGVGLVWLSEGNIISNGIVDINGCHITAGRFKIFDDDVNLLGTPDLTPVEGYELSSKEYTDTKVSLTDNETIAGVKTFSSFPVTPLSNPVTDYQVANKKYVDSRFLDTSLTITVGLAGSGAYFNSLNDALKYAVRNYYPLYDKHGITVKIKMLSGFVMAEQVLVRGLNLGWITIEGEDAETIIDHTALIAIFEDGKSYPAFGVSRGGTSPVIGQLFRFNVEKAEGNKAGLTAYGAGSSAVVLNACGFIGAGTYGILASGGSTINAQGANASNAGSNGILASGGSTINAQIANCSNAGAHGIYAYQGSTINAQIANCSNAGEHGIYALRCSTIDAYCADCSNAGTYGIYACQCSTINTRSANCSNAGAHGIYAYQCSTIDALSADCSNAGTYGINAYQCSTINARSANCSNAGTCGIYAYHGSTIDADAANCSNAGEHGIYALRCSTINAYCAIIQDQTTGESRVRVKEGSHINALGINTTGGTAIALSQAANTLTSNGIIYQ